jgi:hypothetical protein
VPVVTIVGQNSARARVYVFPVCPVQHNLDCSGYVPYDATNMRGALVGHGGPCPCRPEISHQYVLVDHYSPKVMGESRKRLSSTLQVKILRNGLAILLAALPCTPLVTRFGCARPCSRVRCRKRQIDCGMVALLLLCIFISFWIRHYDCVAFVISFNKSVPPHLTRFYACPCDRFCSVRICVGMSRTFVMFSTVDILRANSNA